MANRRPDFKPTRATSPQAIPPDSPLRRRYPPRIAEEDPLVPVGITRSSVRKKAYEVDTGLPPSKKFRIPSPDSSQLFYHSWILLPPEESATFYTNPYALDTQAPSSRSPYHTPEDSTPPKSTYKHKQDQITTMPYNNTAIPPPEEITGVASLPCQFPRSVQSKHMRLISIVARVKKILHIDDEIMACSNNGAFAITIATARSTKQYFT